MAQAAPAFRGRSHEREALDRLLTDVRNRKSATLVIRGEAGIGKTALMQYCVGRADRYRVVQLSGVEAEFELPFAALHQLCGLLQRAQYSIPDPQADALDIALGLKTGRAPDRFVVGLALLSLLAEVANDEPLVCLIDDAQWLDEASRQVLEFVGRRLLAEAVLLIFAVRDEGDQKLLANLPDLTLEGLTDGEAHALLGDVVLGRLNEQVRDRIIAETRGNPLGLLELTEAMTRAELTGGIGIPDASTVPAHVEQHYRLRLASLPAPTRQLVLVAAADPTADPALVRRAALALGVGAEATTDIDLVEIGSKARFRHPLVRSAAYAGASREDRSAAHLALAAATDPERDPERRAWHRAAAATGYDADVASELERTAALAQRRAGLAAAAALLDRWAALTPDPESRCDRALAAAEAHLHAGAFDAARRLVATSAAIAANDLQRARVEQLNGQIEAAARPGREAPGRLLHAARKLEALDPPRARETYLQAWWAAVLAGQFAPRGELIEISKAARAGAPPADPRPADLLLDGLATLTTEGRQAAEPVLRRALSLFVEDQVSDADWTTCGRSVTIGAFALWDYDAWLSLSRRQVDHARLSGALSSLVLSLNLHAWGHAYCGELQAASAVVSEQSAARDATGIQMASYGARVLAAYRGNPTPLSSESPTLEDELVSNGDGCVLEIVSWATAVTDNACGRYADAMAAAQQLPAQFSFIAPLADSELIEAAMRCGQTEVAQDALARLSAASVADSRWASGLEARGRALIRNGDAAEEHYLASIECLARTPLRPELARSHLVYGEWLRRENRRIDARHQLRTAYDAFVEMGAEGFAERARHELAVTGEQVRKRAEETRNDLTPQEDHVARLARGGCTNSEIAAELFISTRTVEWHLRKVFTKLGVTSRRQLKEVSWN